MSGETEGSSGPRHITLVAISGGLDPHVSGRDLTVQENVDRAVRCMGRVSAYRPDLILLTEAFHCVGVPGRYDALAITVDGEVVKRIRGVAQGLNANIMCPIIERRGSHTFNTALWIDRKGKVSGRYDKIHLTEYEMDCGVTPGAVEPTVMEMDFGRVGAQACFDANWPEDWAKLGAAGVDLIAWPSAFPGGRLLNALATLNRVNILGATWQRRCRLIDMTGRTVAASGLHGDFVVAEIDVDRQLFHLDHHLDKLDEIRAKYGGAVQIDMCEDEAWFALSSRREGLSVCDLIREFGITPLSDYLRCAEDAGNERRADTAASRERKTGLPDG